MADITIQKQGRIYISESEYNALRLTGKLQPNTEYCITKVINKGGTIEGSVVITGDLTVQGKTTTKDIENVSTKNYLITLAEDNTTALTTPAGIKVPKYNGTETGALVFDANGVAYVGDVVLKDDGNIDVAASDLQPLATRGALVDGNLVSWSSANLTLVDSGKKVGDFVTKRSTTDSDSYVYAYSKGGDNGLRVSGDVKGNTIPFRFKDGRVKVGTATEDSDAMPKKQVEDNFVAKNTTIPKAIYAVDSVQKPVNLPYTQDATANTMAQRYTGGRLKVGAPVDVADAATKGYVDAQTTYTHYVTITNTNYIGEILLTMSDEIDEPFDNLTMLRKGLYDIGKTIMATGYLRNKNDTSEPVAVVYGIELDSTGEVIQAVATYQTSTSTDITIIDIQDNGFWTVTDVVK